jgi:hypothetical protein
MNRYLIKDGSSELRPLGSVGEHNWLTIFQVSDSKKQDKKKIDEEDVKGNEEEGLQQALEAVQLGRLVLVVVVEAAA